MSKIGTFVHMFGFLHVTLELEIIQYQGRRVERECEKSHNMFGFYHITSEWKEVQYSYCHGCLHNVSTYKPEQLKKLQKTYIF